jgi:Response regulators consisting of a CheY-like receiver domain and a winged-helix DNA-binding domain
VTLIRLSESLELDPLAYELRRGGRAVRLKRIPMEILLLLLERRPELVTREQIAERVWGPGIFVDTANSINSAIRKIRASLRQCHRAVSRRPRSRAELPPSDQRDHRGNPPSGEPSLNPLMDRGDQPVRRQGAPSEGLPHQRRRVQCGADSLITMGSLRGLPPYLCVLTVPVPAACS